MAARAGLTAGRELWKRTWVNIEPLWASSAVSCGIKSLWLWNVGQENLMDQIDQVIWEEAVRTVMVGYSLLVISFPSFCPQRFSLVPAGGATTRGSLHAGREGNVLSSPLLASLPLLTPVLFKSVFFHKAAPHSWKWAPWFIKPGNYSSGPGREKDKTRSNNKHNRRCKWKTCIFYIVSINRKTLQGEIASVWNVWWISFT